MATVKALPSGYSRDLQDTKHVLFQAVTITNDSLRIMNPIIKTLQINKNAMLKSAQKSYAISLDIAEELVRNGIAFREAHKMVGGLVKMASGAGKNLQSLSDTEISRVTGKGLVPLVSKTIKNINPKNSIQARISIGSPNPNEQERMIKDRKRQIDGYQIAIAKRMKHIRSAFENLATTVKSF
jgi:argininosuccinate lyase